MPQYPLYLPKELIKDLEKAEIDNFSGLVQELLVKWLSNSKTKALTHEEKKRLLENKKKELLENLTKEMEEVEKEIRNIDEHKEAEESEVRDIIRKRKEREEQHQLELEEYAEEFSNYVGREPSTRELNLFAFKKRNGADWEEWLNDKQKEEKGAENSSK